MRTCDIDMSLLTVESGEKQKKRKRSEGKGNRDVDRVFRSSDAFYLFSSLSRVVAEE